VAARFATTSTVSSTARPGVPETACSVASAPLVTVRLGAGPVVLTVEDDGPGIPPALLPEVFDRFARGDTSRSRAAGSTGLGLAIVAAVVEAHHGTVEVESGPGRTVFTVHLPTGRPDQPDRRTASTTTSGHTA
jgi:two-component system OmpR family sensor kinase